MVVACSVLAVVASCSGPSELPGRPDADGQLEVELLGPHFVRSGGARVPVEEFQLQLRVVARERWAAQRQLPRVVVWTPREPELAGDCGAAFAKIRDDVLALGFPELDPRLVERVR